MATTKQLIERYENLIRVMRGLTRHERRYHLDMNTWGSETRCGTTMCAAGFAGSDVWFRRRGFRFDISRLSAPVFNGYGLDGEHIETCGWPAIEEFFGVALTKTSDGNHPVFSVPNNVGEVIRAAKREIKALKEAA